MAKYSKDSPESIQAMFGSIANSYDKTNSMLSLQLHRYWNRKLIDISLKNGGNGNRIADLCCGTGEIALSWLKRSKSPQQATLIDFCNEMLACAETKAQKHKFSADHSLSYIQADVQNIPLADRSVDFITMAYGIRNVKKPEECFQEAFRILDNGGHIGILELTEPKNIFLRFGHSLYLKTVLPVLGKLLTSNRQAYEYLSSSIGGFIKPEELAELLKQNGFTQIQITPLTGGIATVITGKKG